MNAAPAGQHLTNGDHRFGLTAIAGGNKPLERIGRFGLSEHFSKQHLRRDDIQSSRLLQRPTESGRFGEG